jgi:hypothetical protein
VGGQAPCTDRHGPEKGVKSALLEVSWVMVVS